MKQLLYDDTHVCVYIYIYIYIGAKLRDKSKPYRNKYYKNSHIHLALAEDGENNEHSRAVHGSCKRVAPKGDYQKFFQQELEKLNG